MVFSSAAMFTHTRRPDPALLFRKDDPLDLRLGEVVRTDEASYAGAKVVILGCPQDEGVRRNGGRTGAASAPSEIRRWLYRLTVNDLDGLDSPSGGALFDLGDTLIQPTLEETHALHETLVHRLITDGKRVIVLGGGNDLSYPDCAALARSTSPTAVTAINIDAHFDVRADQPRNSGTPYRQLLDEGLLKPDHFYEIGSHAFCNSPHYARYLRDHGAHIIPLSALEAQGPGAIFTTVTSSDPPSSPVAAPGAIFWGFDLDVVRAADAPGVSAPNPLGMTGSMLCSIARLAGSNLRTRIAEFTEVNPSYDIDGRTARLTAVAIWQVLAGFVSIPSSSSSSHNDA